VHKQLKASENEIILPAISLPSLIRRFWTRVRCLVFMTQESRLRCGFIACFLTNIYVFIYAYAFYLLGGFTMETRMFPNAI